MPALAPVLDHLDANLDGSMERLFGLLQDQVDLDRPGLCGGMPRAPPNGLSPI